MTTRRRILSGSAALAFLAGVQTARAAEFTLKCGNNNPPSHPLNLRLQEAASRISAETQGRVELQIFPNNQLGGDTQMLSQVRTGALDLVTMGGNILSTLVPVASLSGIAFSFPDYGAVWRAIDGKLGVTIRNAITPTGLVPFEKAWDNGFRQITSSTKPIASPDDLEGFKIRIPVSPVWTSTFRALGASPLSLNSSEMYTALQTHVADGQENSLTIIDTYKLFEVQKYCALSNHMWEGYWMLASAPVWKGLPADVRAVLEKHINDSAIAERADVAQQNTGLRAELENKGMVFNTVDPQPFKAKLRAARYYEEWEKKFGAAAWSVFTETVGVPS